MKILLALTALCCTGWLPAQVEEQKAPNDAEAKRQYLEAERLSKLGEFESALRSVGKALDAAPKHSQSLRFRGVLEYRLGRLAAARKALEQAAEVNPDDMIGLFFLDLVRQEQGSDSAGNALATIVRDPKRKFAGHALRGLLRMNAGDFARAAADFGSALAAVPKGNTLAADVIALRLWLARARLGDRKAADRELRTYLGKRGDGADEWPLPIARFVLDGKDGDEIRNVAGKLDQSAAASLANYFLANVALMSGDRDRAARRFRTCTKPELHLCPDYDASRVELAKLTAAAPGGVATKTGKPPAKTEAAVLALIERYFQVMCKVRSVDDLDALVDWPSLVVQLNYKGTAGALRREVERDLRRIKKPAFPPAKLPLVMKAMRVRFSADGSADVRIAGKLTFRVKVIDGRWRIVYIPLG